MLVNSTNVEGGPSAPAFSLFFEPEFQCALDRLLVSGRVWVGWRLTSRFVSVGCLCLSGDGCVGEGWSRSWNVSTVLFWSCHYVNYSSDAQGRGWIPPPGVLPCNFFDDSNRKNRLFVSVTRDGRHIVACVTSSWRCHVTYVMTSYVHDGGQNTLFLQLFVNQDIFWCRCDKTIRLVSFSTESRSQNSKMLKEITWPWRMTLKFKVKLSSTCPFITRLVNMMQSWSLCQF